MPSRCWFSFFLHRLLCSSSRQEQFRTRYLKYDWSFPFYQHLVHAYRFTCLTNCSLPQPNPWSFRIMGQVGIILVALTWRTQKPFKMGLTLLTVPFNCQRMGRLSAFRLSVSWMALPLPNQFIAIAQNQFQNLNLAVQFSVLASRGVKFNLWLVSLAQW